MQLIFSLKYTCFFLFLENLLHSVRKVKVENQEEKRRILILETSLVEGKVEMQMPLNMDMKSL